MNNPAPGTRGRDVLEGLEGYTAGPWRAEGFYVKPKGREIAISACASVGFMPEETYANTRLQARAPDLKVEVESLREVLRECLPAVEKAADDTCEEAYTESLAWSDLYHRARSLLPTPSGEGEDG